MRVVVAGGARGRALAEDLRMEGVEVIAVVAATAPAAVVADATADAAAAGLVAALSSADVLVVDADRAALTAALVAACDRFGVRIVARCTRASDQRLAERFGVRAVDADAPAREVIDPAAGDSTRPVGRGRGRVIVVWGAAGSPGRTTLAIGLAAELARDGRRVALVDADSHAPSVALATGLADEGPGFAAACRQAARGALSVDELERISLPHGGLSVLTGINRPGRWPELSVERVQAALTVCRDWADDVVVDVAASLELDEEIVSDLDGPRRNAATLGALRVADLVVAVVAADPVGISRFVRAHSELRAVIGATPVRILVNKTRPGVLGLDPRTQVRRAIERYAGAGEMWFAPADARAVDAALLSAQPVLRAAGRSALTAAIRRFVGEALEPPPPPPSPRRRRRRPSRRPVAPRV